MLLENKVALITGASRDIGEATAHTFARAGAAVVLAARDAEALDRIAKQINEDGGTALAVPTDVADEAQVIQMVQAAVERFGRLDVAFNNAGGAPGYEKALLVDVPVDIWEGVVNVNLRGTYLCMRHEVPAMLDNGGGAIVNSSSVAGIRGGASQQTPLVAAKHGLEGLTKAAARDYADQGIRVNSVVVGTVPSRRWRDLRSEEYQENVINAVPMKRFGRAEEVAAAALWLCSDQASYTTGSTIVVDGGLTA
jgi:NAD(P)-dependent dehydrogenase (short-subunit alcohol dehydrogenase family)